MTGNIQPDPASVISFMIITDNHVGYSETDPIRGQDALISFEETLQFAKANNVDFILHGGDLFHEARPSRESQYGVFSLLKHYLSDTEPSSSLRVLRGPQPRGQDLPMFMIHGNHDEPTGERNLSAADLCEASGLIHYFGKHERVDEEIIVKPILMQKGTTKLALFGLGNLKDERLHRMFLSGKVTFERPPDDWFNVMTIHQNRFRGNHMGAPSKSCIIEEFLPSFLKLVVWGHEHESKPEPQEFLNPGFHVLQPGSSVAASLTAAEACTKHVVLVRVFEDKFQTQKFPLLTVRPLLLDEIPLGGEDVSAAVERLAGQGRAEALHRWNLRQEFLNLVNMKSLYSHTQENFVNFPLIRIKVSAAAMSKSTTTHKFGLQYADRVANPGSMLHVVPLKRTAAPRALQGLDLESAEDLGPNESVQDLVFRYMGTEDASTMLDLFAEPDLNEAVQAFVHGSDPHAIDRFVRSTTESIRVSFSDVTGEFNKEALSACVQAKVRARADTLRQARLLAPVGALGYVTDTGNAAPSVPFMEDDFRSPHEKRVSDYLSCPSESVPRRLDSSDSDDVPTRSPASAKAKAKPKAKAKAKPKRLDEIFEEPAPKRRILGTQDNANTLSTQSTRKPWPVLNTQLPK